MPSLTKKENGTRHIHTYVKRRQTDKQVRCDDPRCTHFTTVYLALGKESICSQCRSEVFILDRESLKRARPRCLKCSATKEAQRVKRNKQVLAELGLLS